MIGKDTFLNEIQKSSQLEEQSKPIGIVNMHGLNTEFTHSNKWWAFIPLGNMLGKNYSNLELNLTRFALPSMEMGSATVQFKGYEYAIPTKLLDAGEKTITLDYIIDAKWQNYRSLFKWCSAAEGQINKVAAIDDVERITNKDFLDTRIYLLDHFKNEIISFTFYNTWIKNFGDLAMEANNPEEIHHSITMIYSNYEIDDVKS